MLLRLKKILHIPKIQVLIDVEPGGNEEGGIEPFVVKVNDAAVMDLTYDEAENLTAQLAIALQDYDIRKEENRG